MNLPSFELKLGHYLALGGTAATTLVPLVAHFVDPTILGDVGTVLAPIGAFITTIAALLLPSPVVPAAPATAAS
jgi:hypothetical protein